MAKAVDMDRFFRIPADNRDLNYGKYFVEGEPRVASFDDYTSHNTRQLSVPEIADVLRALPFIQEQLCT